MADTSWSDKALGPANASPPAAKTPEKSWSDVAEEQGLLIPKSKNAGKKWSDIALPKPDKPLESWLEKTLGEISYRWDKARSTDENVEDLDMADVGFNASVNVPLHVQNPYQFIRDEYYQVGKIGDDGLFKAAAERYGVDPALWRVWSTEQRKIAMNNHRDGEIREKHGLLVDDEDANTLGWGTVGEFGKYMAGGPIAATLSVVPIMKAKKLWKLAAASGSVVGGISGFDSYFRQLWDKGEVSEAELLLDTGAGFGLGAMLPVAGVGAVVATKATYNAAKSAVKGQTPKILSPVKHMPTTIDGEGAVISGKHGIVDRKGAVVQIRDMNKKQANQLWDKIDEDTMNAHLDITPEELAEGAEVAAKEFGVEVEQIGVDVASNTAAALKLRRKHNYHNEELAHIRNLTGKDFPKWDPASARSMDYLLKRGPAEHELNTLQAAGLGTRQGADKIFGHVDTRISNINQPVGQKVHTADYDILTGNWSVDRMISESSRIFRSPAKRNKGAVPRPEIARNKHGELRIMTGRNQADRIWGLMQDGKWDLARGFAGKISPEAVEQVNKLQHTLDLAWKDIVDTGIYHTDSMIPGYFPRVLKDRNGMLKAMGRVDRNAVDELLWKARQTKGKALSPFEKDNIITQYFRYGNRKGGKFKRRVFKDIPPKLRQFYYNPGSSYKMYMTKVISETAKRRFFAIKGKTPKAKKGEDMDDNGIAIQKSADEENKLVGEFVADILKRSNMTKGEAAQLTTLLDWRFNAATRDPNAFVRTSKDVFYAAMLANFRSAITQTADIYSSMYRNGMRYTIEAVLSRAGVFGKQKIGKLVGNKKWANERQVIETAVSRFSNELQHTESGSSYMLNFLMDKPTSLFGPTDRGVKGFFADATLRKSYAQLDKGTFSSFLVKKYGVWGDAKLQELVRDLKAVRRGKEVDIHSPLHEFVITELSEHQPIFMTSKTEGQMRSPNFVALVYLLKSWSLRQVDLMRRHGVNQWRNGNKAGGAYNLAKIGVFLTAANMAKDEIHDMTYGREESDPWSYKAWETFTETVLLAIKQNIEHNSRDGTFEAAAVGFGTPPIIGLLDKANDARNLALEAAGFNDDLPDEERMSEKEKQRMGRGILRLMPGPGPHLAEWYLGGKEHHDDKVIERELKRLKDLK